jgi:lipoate-protein ligase A
MKLKVIRTSNTNPYENLAAEEYLTCNANDDEMILFLWQNAHTVVIGRNQNPWTECSVEKIKEDGVYLARRMSGGGAVYHDMGNLNFTFAARDGIFDVSKQTDVILIACRIMGINASLSGRNDLTIGERKFSGHAYFSSGGYNYHHGTIMVNVNGDDLPKYLNVPDDKLRSKGVASVRSRVTNIIDHIPGYKLAEICGNEAALEAAETGIYTPEMTAQVISAMMDAMIRAASREYGSVEMMELPQIPQELIGKYTSEEWRLGTRIPFSKEIEHRFEWGGVRIEMEMRGEYIADIRIYSDALETEIFTVLEDLLRGCRYDSGEILGLRLPQGVNASAYEILELIAASIR